ncbi:hypothetical protein Lalb_Chr18g0049921 [Lupinus albus]|uniref:Uncharacterized protein n=1 Tax=Lupinus albus TaxID=3870 RepID=A0A6A4NK82_LUPAL|nr:hypothetical protein Lalb_Chr18g0049921 [Lupinus albus]
MKTGGVSDQLIVGVSKPIGEAYCRLRFKRLDPRVGGGVGGTSAVTHYPTQHSPR